MDFEDDFDSKKELPNYFIEWSTFEDDFTSNLTIDYSSDVDYHDL